MAQFTREVSLDREWATAYAASLGDDPERYERDGVVHPMTAFALSFPLLEQSLATLPGEVGLKDILHSEQQIVLDRPLAPEAMVRVRAEISPPYAYGMRAAATICTLLSGDDGGSARLRTVIVVPCARGLTEPPERLRIPRRGAEVGAGSVGIDEGTVMGYSATSGDRNPIHLDPDAARAENHPSALVPGMLTFGLVLSAAARQIGERWQPPRSLALVMQRRVVVGDTLQWSARDVAGGLSLQATNAEGTVVRGVVSSAPGAMT